MATFTIDTGHLGADAEIRTLASGKRVANLRVAENPRAYKDRETGQWVNPPAQWFSVSIYVPGIVDWAEKKLTKGSSVGITGELRPRKYIDNSTGEERHTIDLVVNNRAHSVIGRDLKEEDQARDDD